MKFYFLIFFIFTFNLFAFEFGQPYMRVNKDVHTFDLAKKTFIHPKSGRKVVLLSIIHFAKSMFYQLVEQNTQFFFG